MEVFCDSIVRFGANDQLGIMSLQLVRAFIHLGLGVHFTSSIYLSKLYMCLLCTVEIGILKRPIR